MKKVMKMNLKANNLESQSLSKKEMSLITGGRACYCACYYRYVEGSSIQGNRSANYSGGPNGLSSPQMTADAEIEADLPGGGTDIW